MATAGPGDKWQRVKKLVAARPRARPASELGDASSVGDDPLDEAQYVVPGHRDRCPKLQPNEASTVTGQVKLPSLPALVGVPVCPSSQTWAAAAGPLPSKTAVPRTWVVVGGGGAMVTLRVDGDEVLPLRSRTVAAKVLAPAGSAALGTQSASLALAWHSSKSGAPLRVTVSELVCDPRSHVCRRGAAAAPVGERGDSAGETKESSAACSRDGEGDRLVRRQLPATSRMRAVRVKLPRRGRRRAVDGVSAADQLQLAAAAGRAQDGEATIEAAAP